MFRWHKCHVHAHEVCPRVTHEYCFHHFVKIKYSLTLPFHHYNWKNDLTLPVYLLNKLFNRKTIAENISKVELHYKRLMFALNTI